VGAAGWRVRERVSFIDILGLEITEAGAAYAEQDMNTKRVDVPGIVQLQIERDAALAEVKRLQTELEIELEIERRVSVEHRASIVEVCAEVKRLRACYATATAAEGRLQQEIAELKAQREFNAAAFRDVSLVQRELNAEIARLRAALAVFANCENWDTHDAAVAAPLWNHAEIEEPWTIAREALSGGTE